MDPMNNLPGCAGKVAFPSWTQATRQAKKMRHGNLRPYHCQACQFVHLGNTGKLLDQRRVA